MMFQMMLLAKEFFRRIGVSEEKGQGLIEYALIVLLVSIVVIVTLGLVGDQVEAVFENIRVQLGGAAAPVVP